MHLESLAGLQKAIPEARKIGVDPHKIAEAMGILHRLKELHRQRVAPVSRNYTKLTTCVFYI